MAAARDELRRRQRAVRMRGMAVQVEVIFGRIT
jgi:hypothetical protein